MIKIEIEIKHVDGEIKVVASHIKESATFGEQIVTLKYIKAINRICDKSKRKAKE